MGLASLSIVQYGNKSFRVTAPTLDKDSYLAELRQIIEREQVSLVVPVSEEILFVSELQGQLPESVRIVCVAQEKLLSLHDKYRFMRLAQAHQLPVPQSALASDRRACAELMKKPFVIKPRFSCSGAGVRFGSGSGSGQGLVLVLVLVLEQGQRQRQRQRQIRSWSWSWSWSRVVVIRPARSVMSDTYIVQERLHGAACCSFSIVDSGTVLSSVCYHSLLESGSVSVCFEQMRVPDDIALFIKSVVAATAHSGMIAFDFIQDDAGVWRAIECNPRATSGLYFLDHQSVLAELIESNAGYCIYVYRLRLRLHLH